MASQCWFWHREGSTVKSCVNRWSLVFSAAVLALWVVTVVAWVLPETPPIVHWNIDSVSPTSVMPGGTITITRNFVVIRKQKVHVTRTMVKGDCTKQCEFLDISNGTVLLDIGDYPNTSREHVIPQRATPGMWTINVSMSWVDSFGRQHSMSMQPLEIEILPKPSRG